MDDGEGSSLCFPNLNSSCRRLLLPSFKTALLYVLLAFVSLLTVTLNLLVIISISHFRKLHTPTNALLLSLAGSDLVVGLLVMPIEGVRYLETCWLLGRLMCALTPFLYYCLLSGSLGHMVLISVDRYLAICQPLLYPSRVTLSRVVFLICLCWGCSALYNACILMGHLQQPHRVHTCHGECVLVISHTSGTVDLFFSLVGPCSVMLVLYARVFVAAVSQVSRLQTVPSVPTVKRWEWKAARTLGIVIAVFLMCFCPYFYPSLTGQDTTTKLSYYAVLSWVMLLNSCMNPLIYALFYPWFRKTTRLIVTLKILQLGSSETKIL